ncbi:MAG: MIP/aquaporin family protein [Sphingomonadales bacterium]|nr:aquaporin family protein [Sphingomonadales bacterium]
MNPVLTEFIGTALLILLGCGVNANNTLHHSHGKNSGWLLISFGWGLAVFVAVYVSVSLGGAGHLNPAVSFAMLLMNKLSPALCSQYVVAQLGGAFTGAVLVWLSYRDQFNQHPHAEEQLGVFATGPGIRNDRQNLISETLASFAFLFAILCIQPATASMGSLDALTVALLVMAIGMCLGGTTGYPLNPARDLGPRLAHFLLPLKGKGKSNWDYAWLPVAAPLLGAALAVLLYQTLVK